jgi:hypothetical protein
MKSLSDWWNDPARQQIRKNRLITPEMMQNAVPMGTTKKMASLYDLTGSPEARASIASFEGNMANYARKTTREMALNYRKRMQEEAFKRAHSGFDAGKVIAKYISRFK